MNGKTVHILDWKDLILLRYNTPKQLTESGQYSQCYDDTFSKNRKIYSKIYEISM